MKIDWQSVAATAMFAACVVLFVLAIPRYIEVIS